MATRPVYTALDEPPYVRRTDVDFEFFPGFSMKQKRRTIDSLHAAFLGDHPGEEVLEISTKSPEPLGVALSPFNLPIRHGDHTYPVESAFQSSKRFENGGPYVELLDATAREARRDPRLKESGDLVGFEYFGETFPAFPRTYFYDWLYINALNQNPDLAEQLLGHTNFTDIEFNPARSKNCQAHAAALFTGMSRAGVLNQALQSKEAFLKTAYPDHPVTVANEDENEDEDAACG